MWQVGLVIYIYHEMVNVNVLMKQSIQKVQKALNS